MKNTMFSLFFILFSVIVCAQKNTVEINGWTNINTFKCNNFEFKNSTSIYSFTGKQLPSIFLNVVDFDCRNKMMTADFRKTLNAVKYPVLSIKFLNFNRTNTKFLALVEVKMMNIARNYTIEFSEYNNSLVGNKRMKFSDFKIVPPRKMGGMVYVKDELDLLFSLAVKN